MKFTFEKPIKFEEKDYTDINLKLDSLSARDISRIKNQWATEGNFSPYPATDLDFCVMVAMAAAKLPTEFIDKMSAKDYIKLAQEVSNFLQS